MEHKIWLALFVPEGGKGVTFHIANNKSEHICNLSLVRTDGLKHPWCQHKKTMVTGEMMVRDNWEIVVIYKNKIKVLVKKWQLPLYKKMFPRLLYN